MGQGNLRLAALAIVLTWVAGFVDAVGYLTLDRLYTANMSGNTVGLGIRWAEGNWPDLARRGWPVLMFVLGLLLSAVVLESAKRTGVRSRFWMTLGLENILLIWFIVWGSRFLHRGEVSPSAGPAFYGLVALLALAMGLQNATLTHVGSLNVHTTHVTGALTTLARDLSAWLFWAFDRLRARAWPNFQTALSESARQEGFRGAAFMLVLWIVFALGGVAGAVLRSRWGFVSLTPCCVALALTAAADLAHLFRYD